MRLVECINDSGYREESLKYIKMFPVKGEIYTILTKVVFNGETGYILEELINPPMANGYIPNFNKKRFKDIQDDLDIKLLLKETETIYEDI